MNCRCREFPMKSARTKFAYQSRGGASAAGAVLGFVGAASTGIVAYMASTNEASSSLLFRTVSFLFLLTGLAFCFGFICRFEQEVEATETSLKWTCQRFPKVKKEFALREISSLVIHTLDDSATKLVMTLASGEVVQIPFSHFLCDKDEAKALVQFLKSKQPSMAVSVA